MKRAMSHLAAVLMWFGAAISAQAQDADIALVNGKIVTLDDRGSVAEALAVRDGKIVAVGS